MMECLATKRRTAIPRQAARLAITAIVMYQVTLIVLIFLRPDLDPSWHTVSEWAIGRYGWIMSCAFVLSGASYAALLVALWSQLKGSMGLVARCFLLTCAIGAVGVGFFTTDPMPLRSPLTVRGTLHVVCGTSQLVLFPLAALFTSLGLSGRSDAWASMRRALLRIAGLPLLGFVSFAAYTVVFVIPLGPQAYGPGVNIGWPPRIAFLTYAIWVVSVAGWAIQVYRGLDAEQSRISVNGITLGGNR